MVIKNRGLIERNKAHEINKLYHMALCWSCDWLVRQPDGDVGAQAEDTKDGSQGCQSRRELGL